MSLLDDLESLTRPPAEPCRYARLADELSAEEWDAVERMAQSISEGTAPDRVGWKTLADKLRANGHRITDQSIKKHAIKDCTCGTS